MSNNNAIDDYYQWWDGSAPNTTNTTYTYSSNTAGDLVANTTGSTWWDTTMNEYVGYDMPSYRNIKVSDLRNQQEEKKECTCMEDHDLITVAEFKEFIKDLILNKKNGNLPDYDDWKEIKQMMDRIYDPEKCECFEQTYITVDKLEGSIDNEIAQKMAQDLAVRIEDDIIQKYSENVSYSDYSYEFVAITPFETSGGDQNNVSTQWYNSVAAEKEKSYTNTAFLGC